MEQTKKPLQKNLSAALALAGAAGAAAYCVWENNALTVTRYTVKKGLPAPIRIVCLADLHGKRFGKDNCRLLKKTAALSPDLIVLPGDTVSGSRHGVSAMCETLSALSSLAPTVLIPGNHERRTGRLEALLARFSRTGAHVLCNERLDLLIRGTPVHLLGLAEPIAVSRLDYLRAAVGRLEYPDCDAQLLSLAREDGLRIVLSHFPELFAAIGDRSYRRFDFDLQFSGHAHGGQVRLPGIGGVYAPGQGIFPRYTGGLYGKSPALVVSRGLGNDCGLPRVNNRPEIVAVDVV